MKKLMTIALVCAAAMAATTFTACDKGGGGGDDNGDRQIVLPDQSEQTQQAYADEQTTGGFTFVAKAAWTATVAESGATRANGVSWLRLRLDGEETYSGAAGTFNLAIELDENYSGKTRTATITITSGGTSITITVTQEGTTESGETPEPKPSLSELVARCEELHEWVDAAWLQIDNNYSVYTARLSLTQATPELYDFWTKSYQGIADCNLLLESLDSDSSLTEPQKAGYRGRAYADRATAYFFLKTLWGGVPMTTDGTAANTLPRSTANEVIGFVFNDIDRADALAASPFTSIFGLVREVVLLQEDDGVQAVIETLRSKMDNGEITWGTPQDDNTEYILASMMLAEALLKTGNRQEALTWVNVIDLGYGGAPSLPESASENDIRAAILARYSTLGDTGMKFLNAVRLEDAAGIWGYRVLMPIPLRAMNNNPQLAQNPGW